MYVYDDKIVFTYNFKDGTETLTLRDIEAAFGSDFTNFSPPKRNPILPDGIFFLVETGWGLENPNANEEIKV